jgi:hypothetical protein
MPTRTQGPETADLPAIDGSDLKVVRFGNGAAVLILLLTAGLAVVAVNVALRDHFYVEQKSRRPALPIPVEAQVESASTTEAEIPAPVEAGLATSQAPDSTGASAPSAPQQTDPGTQESNERIDQAFAVLDQSNIEDMRAFLRKYDGVKYAEERGYLSEVSDALQAALAKPGEQPPAPMLNEDEEEQKRRQEQQAVPWDMGVEPPASGN